MIKDIYHWRLQTTLAIVAGYATSIPKQERELTATGSLELQYGWQQYTAINSRQSTNTGSLQCGKHSMHSFESPPSLRSHAPRLIPGLMTIEVVTLGFPIYAIFKNKKAAREVNDALAEFDQKRLQSFDEGTTLGSSGNSLKISRGSTKGSKTGKMYPMESLDACLSGNHDGLQVYASCMELNGENIIFLTKVIAFTQHCQKAFYETCKSTSDFRRARTAMFRIGLSIFVSLVHSGTASYPINIESHIYAHLDAIFGPATALVASAKSASRSPSIASSSKITPWDDPADDSTTDIHDEHNTTKNNNTKNNNGGYFGSQNSYPMRAMSGRKSSGNESSERIVTVQESDLGAGADTPDGRRDPLEGVKVPGDFDERVFDAAFKSVRFMVWTETWQRYMRWKRGSGSEIGD